LIESMTVQLNPYFNFRGEARDALAFYQSVFGGTVESTTFGEMPGLPHGDVDPNHLMHGMLQGDNGIVLMAADAPPSMEAHPPTTAISLSGDDDATLRGYFDNLSDGATDVMPLNQAPWGDTFGMLTDRFGVPWMVNIVASS
jgi:PhnB protein